MQKATSGPAIPWGVFSIVLIGTFLGPLGGIIVAVALPTIAKDFGIELQAAKWVLLVYQVTTTFLLPVMGRLGQRFGDGRLFVLGFGIDAIGTLGSALVPQDMFWLLIATRVLQALGSAFLFALFSSLTTRVIPPERRGLAFGIIGATVAISLVVAAPLGGFLCAAWGWRWVFLIQLPFHLLGLYRGWKLLPRDPVGAAEPLPLLSLPLWLLIVSGLVFCAEALEKNWAVQYAGLAAVVTGLAMLAFVLAERMATPLFYYGLFRYRAFWLGALGTMALNLTFQVMIFLIPFYLQDYLGFNPRQSGMLLCLSPLLTLFAAPLGGMLGDRVGARIPAVMAFLCGAAGFACMAGAGMQGNLTMLGVGLGLLGICGGLFNGPVIATMMGAVQPSERSYASSFNSLARNLGFVSGTVLTSLLLALYLGGPLRTPATDNSTTSAVLAMDAAPAERADFQQAAGRIFWLCGGLCLLLAGAYWWYPRRAAGHASVEPAVS